MIFLAAAAAAPPWPDPNSQFNFARDLFLGIVGIALVSFMIWIVVRAYAGLSGRPVSLLANTGVGELSHEYRRKLVQWLSSAALLLTVTVLCVCTMWFVNFPQMYWLSDVHGFADQMAGPLAQSLGFYLFAFVPVFLWHIADFIELERPKGKKLFFLSSHTLLIGILFSFGVAFIMLATGWFTVSRPCGGLFVLLFQSCMGPAPTIALPFQLLMLSLPLHSLLKLAVALRSRLRIAR